MSVGHYGSVGVGLPPQVSLPATEQQPLQRLAQVRRQQGVSRRTIARRLNIDLDRVREQERETTDLNLSALYAWQKALDVPVGELLVEASDTLTSPILQRSQLVRLMKTVLAICETAKQESVRRMCQTMIGQLVEIMPELENVSAWHTVGKRRRLNELGVAAQRRLAEEVFVDHGD